MYDALICIQFARNSLASFSPRSSFDDKRTAFSGVGIYGSWRQLMRRSATDVLTRVSPSVRPSHRRRCFG